MDAITFGPLSEIIAFPAATQTIMHTLTTTKERFPAENQAKNWIERLFEDTIAGAVQASVHPQIQEAIQEAIDGFTLVEDGRPEDPTAAVAWDEKAGNVMEELLSGDIAKALGQGWLGENTIGPRFDNPETLERIATEAAVGVGKHYATISTPEAIGLNALELEAFAPKLIGIPASLDRRKGKNAAAPKVDKATRARVVLSAVAGLLNLFAAHELEPELDLIGDYDDVLSPGAIERLGIKDAVVIEALKSSYADAPVKRNWAGVVVREAQNLSAAGSNETEASTSATGASASPQAETATGAADTSVAPPLPTDKTQVRRRNKKNTVPNASAVRGLNKLLSCMSHQEAADLIKVTKGTITHYKEGKSPFAPSTYELAALTAHATKLRDELNMALEDFEAAALE